MIEIRKIIYFCFLLRENAEIATINILNRKWAQSAVIT